ncbi:MAG: hypothetical protein ACNA7V_13955 [Bacteroidales bacterium]
MQKHRAAIFFSALQGIGFLDEYLPEAAIAVFNREIHGNTHGCNSLEEVVEEACQTIAG